MKKDGGARRRDGQAGRPTVLAECTRWGGLALPGASAGPRARSPSLCAMRPRARLQCRHCGPQRSGGYYSGGRSVSAPVTRTEAQTQPRIELPRRPQRPARRRRRGRDRYPARAVGRARVRVWGPRRAYILISSLGLPLTLLHFPGRWPPGTLQAGVRF